MVQSINKSLLPLVKDDTDFIEAGPNLFGPDFSKRAKDHLDQVKSLKAAAFPMRQQSSHNYNRPQGSGHVFTEATPRRGARPKEDTTDQEKKLSVSNSYMYSYLSFKNTIDSKFSVNKAHNCSKGDNSPQYSVKPSGSAGTLYNKLEKSNQGPVGPEYHNRVRDRIHLGTLPISKTISVPTESKSAGFGIPRDHGNDLKRDNIRDTYPTRGQFFLYPLPGTKDRWGPEACHKSKNLNSFINAPHFKMEGIHTLKSLRKETGL